MNKKDKEELRELAIFITDVTFYHGHAATENIKRVSPLKSKDWHDGAWSALEAVREEVTDVLERLGFTEEELDAIYEMGEAEGNNSFQRTKRSIQHGVQRKRLPYEKR